MITTDIDKKVTEEEIIRDCCHLFRIPVEDITSTNRHQQFVVCRAFISFFLRGLLHYSTPLIGRAIKRDHSNVVHLLKTIDVYLKMDPLYNNYFTHLKEKFSGFRSPLKCPTCGHYTL